MTALSENNIARSKSSLNNIVTAMMSTQYCQQLMLVQKNHHSVYILS